MPDTWLTMWALAWDVHGFMHRPWAIFDANIYYPLHDTLAFSENFLGSAALAAPVIWTTSNLALALNLVSIATVVLCGVGAYRLGRVVGLGPAGALVCGIVFAFSPPRFMRITQLHVAAVEWVPFGLASLYAYFERGRARDLKWAVAFASLQALTSGHGAIFLGISIVLLVAYRVVRRLPVRMASWPRDLGATGAIAIVPALLAFLPYLAVQRDVGLRRSLDGWTGTAASSFVASPSVLQTWIVSSLFPTAHIYDSADAFLFPGLLPVALALFALVPRKRVNAARVAAVVLDAVAIAALGCAAAFAFSGPLRVRAGDVVLLSVKSAWRPWLVVAVAVIVRAAMARRVPFRSPTTVLAGRDGAPIAYFALLTCVSVWLIIGPPIGLWPYVYALPGFNFIRAPARFSILGILGLAVLSGFGVERFQRGRWLGTAIVTAMIAEFACVPLSTDALTLSIPAADRWLNTQPKPFVVAEVPVPPTRRLGPSERVQTLYMFHSTAHWQKTVHGYSGFRLPLHADLYDAMARFPDVTSLDALERLGVTYVVVHLDLYEPAERRDVLRRVQVFSDRLRRVYEDETGRVYALASGSARTR